MCSPQHVLHFWFHVFKPEQWFDKNEFCDQQIRQQFLTTTEAAAQGECSHWRYSIYGRLAEIIVLDQFSRNIWRDNPRAFSQDGMSLVLAQEAVKLSEFHYLKKAEKQFILMPFMHSESVKIQEQSLILFEQLEDENALYYAIMHKKIIDRFGRYPHRNKILNRPSTAQEIRFLQEPNSSF